MPLTRQRKALVIDALRERFRGASIVVAVNFHGLSVNLANEFRVQLRNADTKYMVAKKTLVARVLDECDYEGNRPPLKGELGLAFGAGDAIAAAQALHAFAKKHREELRILGGVYENSYVDEETIVQLASIPPRPVLLTQFLTVLESPVQGFVGVLNNVISSFITVLSNYGGRTGEI